MLSNRKKSVRKNQFYINHYNQIQKSARFTLAFAFFLELSLVHDSKFPLLYMLWVENISRLFKQKVEEKKIWATFYEFKVFIFLLKVLLYLLIIFWKIRIDTLYEEMVLGKTFTPEKFPPTKLPTGKLPRPLKLQPTTFSPGMFLTFH